jgi:hypothetical protein
VIEDAIDPDSTENRIGDPAYADVVTTFEERRATLGFGLGADTGYENAGYATIVAESREGVTITVRWRHVVGRSRLLEDSVESVPERVCCIDQTEVSDLGGTSPRSYYSQWSM